MAALDLLDDLENMSWEMRMGIWRSVCFFWLQIGDCAKLDFQRLLETKANQPCQGCV